MRAQAVETPDNHMNTIKNNKGDSDKSEKYAKIKSKINGFAESSEVLLKVLEEVQGIHPFIGVAVIAFKAIVTLELKRRENDDKVMFLLVKIQELMETLVQLRAIPSGQRTKDQHLTVEEKLKLLCAKIKEDIERCGNLCDTFSKKRFLVKLLKGPIYEIRLVEMGQTLDERQKELEFALLLFTAHGIHLMKEVVRSTQDDVSMLLLLQMLSSSEEKEFLTIVESKGGASKCIQDEKILAELIQIRRSIPSEQPTVSDPDMDEDSIGHEQGPTSTFYCPPFQQASNAYPAQATSPYSPGSSDHHRQRSRHTHGYNAGYVYTKDPPRPSYQTGYPPHFFTVPDADGYHERYRRDPPVSIYRTETPYDPGGYSPDLRSRSHYPHRSRGGYAYDSDRKRQPRTETEIKQLKEELVKNVDEEVNQNQTIFLRKFKAQQRQLELIQLTVVKQGDRVVREVHRGPHDRIHDEELRNIWREMGWKLIVPSIEFVRTLHDYFVSQHKDMQILDDHFNHPPEPGSTVEDEMAALARALKTAKQHSEDKWALRSLDLTKLQPVMEAFDADCSGYVSVWEANQAISLRPNGWSLLQWVAYWASGRHSTIAQYSTKIREIIRKMHLLLRESVLPVNWHMVKHYLDRMKTLERALVTTLPCNDAPEGELAQRISRYNQAEEERMEYVLQALNYEIDGSDTIELITSRYQIERNFFPLVYLLLKRHLSVIRLACDVALDARELDIATGTLKTIFKAVKAGVLTLESMIPPGPGLPRFLQSFAFGMYYGVYLKDKLRYPSFEEEEEKEVNEKDGDKNNDTKPATSLAPVSWLTQGLPTVADPLQFYSSADPIQFESCIGEYVNGYWSGYLKNDDLNVSSKFIQFRVSNWEGTTFTGDGSYSEGIIRVEGSYDTKTDVLEGKIVGIADCRGEMGDPDFKIFFSGSVDVISFGHVGKQYQMACTWKTSKEGSRERFTALSQTPAWAFGFRLRSFRPQARERWRFTAQAVLHQVRSKRGTLHRTFCFEKLKEIRDSVYILKKRLLLGVQIEEYEEALLKKLTPSDSRLCHWLARFSVWPTVHFNAKCMCGRPIIGSRLLKIDFSLGRLEDVCQHEIYLRLHPWYELIKVFRYLHRQDEVKLLDVAKSLVGSALVKRFIDIPPHSPHVHSMHRWGSKHMAFAAPPPVPPLRSPVSSSSPATSVDGVSLSTSSSSSSSSSSSYGAYTDSLSCICCRAVLPDEKTDAVWICLECSVPTRPTQIPPPEPQEKLFIMCSGCESMNRRCMDRRFRTHTPYHALLQVRTWPRHRF